MIGTGRGGPTQVWSTGGIVLCASGSGRQQARREQAARRGIHLESLYVIRVSRFIAPTDKAFDGRKSVHGPIACEDAATPGIDLALDRMEILDHQQHALETARSGVGSGVSRLRLSRQPKGTLVVEDGGGVDVVLHIVVARNQRFHEFNVRALNRSIASFAER